ncbi:MAG: hypothetical protein PHO10_06005 [Gemmiger sp.]|nr:hypothetical protein [Gemmiger sp.]
MKTRTALLQKKAALPALCYLVAAVGWLAVSTWNFGADMAAKANGTLREQPLAVSDFALADLEVTGTDSGGATLLETTSNDPQMILEDVSAQTVRTVQLYVRYTGTVREMCLYYTTAPGQDYSQDRRVFPALQPDGSYLYTLPRTRLVALRLDPCSPEEGKTVAMAVETILLNRPVAPAGYFVPSWYQLFCLALYPGLAAALLSWLGAAAALLPRKR